MARVRSAGSAGESAALDALRRAGFALRTHDASLPGRPDAALPRARVAVFIDGRAWHGGQHLRRGRATLEAQFARARRQAYWVAKVERNIERDFRVTAALLAMGWRVVRVWEEDATRDPALVVERVRAARDRPDAPETLAMRTLRVPGDTPAPPGWSLVTHGRSTLTALIGPSRGGAFWQRQALDWIRRWRRGASPATAILGPPAARSGWREALSALAARGGVVDACLTPGPAPRLALVAFDRRLSIPAGALGTAPEDDPARPRWVRRGLETLDEADRAPALLPAPGRAVGGADALAWVAARRVTPWLVEALRAHPMGPRG